MDKASFSKSITEALKPTTSNIDLNRTLYNFQHTVNAYFLTQFKKNEIPDLFRNIWKFLLTAANNQSSTTRLASYRATGAFLTRVTPYYPALVHESFSEVSLLVTIDVKSSAIIASSFAFISRYIANPFMKKFINSTPVFHHFCSDDPAFSEHLPTIISNLKHLGSDWLKNLLQFFLEKIEESALASRYLIKAVSAIVGHNPKLYIQQILDWMHDNTTDKNSKADESIPLIQKKYISLFIFFISGHQEEIEDCVDLYPIAHSSALLLSQSTTENCSLSDLDAALQMLSTPSLSFRVQVKFDPTNTNMCKITVIKTIKSDSSPVVVDDETQKIEVDLNSDNFSQRPSFYMIHLPLENLRPRDDDSLLILRAKFKSLSTYYTGIRLRSNDNDDRTIEVYEIYQPYLKSDYNEQRSAAIQGLSICINSFIQKVPIDKLIVSLRRVLFADSVSWYHSTDILRVIKKVGDYNNFVEKLGVNFFIELLSCLIGFCFSENESLSKESMIALSNISSLQNINILIKTIYNKTDFLDSFNLKRSCTMMSLIINKIKKSINELNHLPYDENFIDDYRDETKIKLYDEVFKLIPELDLYVNQLIECVPLYYDDLYLLTHIHQFFSIYKVEKSYQFRPVICTAICIAISTAEVISGQDVISIEKYEQTLNQTKPHIPESFIKVQSSSNNDDEDSPIILFYRHFKRLVEQDIMNKNVDIITESFSGDDDKSFILPLRNALLCTFVYATEEDAISIAILTYQLYPLENSKFFNMTWQTVPQDSKSKILKNMPNFLKYENDEHIHIEWCSMCLQQLDIVTTDSDYLILVDILVEAALNFFQRPNETNGSLAAVYCKFLIGIHYGNANTVIEKYLAQLTENDDNIPNLKQIVNGFPEVTSLFPQIFADKKYSSDSPQKIDNDVKLKEEVKMTFDASSEDLKDPTKIQEIFENVVRHNHIWLLKQIIRIADSLNVILDLKFDSDSNLNSLEYSKSAIPIIAQYMADHKIKLSKSALARLLSTAVQNQRGGSDMLFDQQEEVNEEEIILQSVLRHVRTIWGPYYISIIKENPNLLLESLLKKEKVSKNEILSLSYLLNTNSVEFDMQLLFKLASKLIISTSNQSTPLSNSLIRQLSISRYRIIMYFISVVIAKIVSQYRLKKIESVGSVIPADFPNQLVKEIAPDFERLPVDIVTHLFLLLAQNIALSEEVIQFVKRLFTLCSSDDSISNNGTKSNDQRTDVPTVLNRSAPYGYIHQILIGLSSNTRYVGKNYISGLPEIILPCLHSKMPSICMIGMRLLEQALLSIPAQLITPCVHVGFEQIMKKMHYIYIHLPPCIEKVYHTIMSLLTKKDALQLQITFVHNIPDKTSISPHSGGFAASVAYLPAVVAIISPKKFSNFLSVYHYSCETLFNYPASFTSALRSLTEHAKKFNEDDQETIMMNSFINWLNLVQNEDSSEMMPTKASQPSAQILKTKSAGVIFKKKNKNESQPSASKGGRIKGFISNFMKKDKESKVESPQSNSPEQSKNDLQNENAMIEKNLSFGDIHLNMLNKEEEKYLGYAYITPEKIKKQIGQWIDAFCLLMPPSKAFSILCFQLLKNMDFKMVYPSLLKFFINNRDDEELNECFDGILDMPQYECHRVALKLLKTCDKYKEMIQLSTFDSDCPESQKLVDELRDFIPNLT